MTKERLEELIKQGAMIYAYEKNKFNNPCSVNLAIGDWNVSKTRQVLNLNDIKVYELKDLFETIDHYYWQRKVYAERTERFEPPMWEEIKDKYSFGFMNCKNSVVRFSVFKKYNSLNHIVVYSCDYDDYTYRDISTKENYEKACEIVRDLFKGEKNEIL